MPGKKGTSMSPDESPRRRTLVVIVDADLIAAHVAAGKLPIQLIAAAVFKAEPGAKFFGLDRHELSFTDVSGIRRRYPVPDSVAQAVGLLAVCVPLSPFSFTLTDIEETGMALHFDIMLNRDVIGYVAITRRENVVANGKPNVYDVEVFMRTDGLMYKTTVEHVYADGALTLIAKATQAAVDRSPGVV
jgi:hypothetical protein